MVKHNLFLLLTIIGYLGLTQCDGYHLSESFTLERSKRQTSNCSRTEFACASGECITEDAMCDGAEDCADGSDENDCLTFPCPNFLFKCGYGACINAGYVCDGKKDCKDNTDETDPKCATRRPQSKCGKFQFECDNGQCISDTDICDGKADCSDTSDETLKTCVDFACPGFGFRCDYGACITRSLTCNQQNDCYDGSDEKNCTNMPEVPTKRGDCVLPPNPENGVWTLFGPQKMSPGEWVNQGTLLQYRCNDGFGLSPVTTYVVCTPPWTEIPSCLPMSTTSASGPGVCTIPRHPPNGQLIDVQRNLFNPGTTVKQGTIMGVRCKKDYALDPLDEREATCNTTWTKLPKCLKTCNTAQPQPETKARVRCTLNGYKANCDIPVDGTQATYSCLPLYEDASLEGTPSRYCKDGTWDLPKPICKPICGLKSDKVVTLVVGSKPTYKGAYPWMVGLYAYKDRFKEWRQFCGGTMITPRVTLSAAHCFTEQGSVNPADYKVAAGKYYRKYVDDNDKDAQYSDLDNLIIHPDYNNGTSFQSFDIAILVLQTPFRISLYLLPICIEYNTAFVPDALIGHEGYVAGWGFTTAIDKASDVLKEIALDYKSFNQCKVRGDFRPFFLNARDKMCAKSAVAGDSLCQGDSGGGLIFRGPRDRYYIRGIVSIGKVDANTHGCDIDEHVLFTSVAYHAEFIQKNL